MRVENIKLYRNNYFPLKKMDKNFTKNPINFSGIPSTPSQIIEAKIYGEKIKKSSISVQEKAKSYVFTAYKELETAKKSYMNAITYANTAKKVIGNKKVEINDEINIEVASIYKNGKIEPTSIKVFDKDGNNIQDIFFNNSVPVKIVDYISDNRAKITTFDYNKVTISTGFDRKTRDVDALYTFNNGMLSSIKTNIINVPFATYSEDFFAFKDDELFVNEHDTKSLFTGQYHAKHRYNFLNGKLSNYYNNFLINEFRCISWDESCHFDDANFIARTQTARQASKFDNIVAQNATYKAGNMFITTNNLICEIDDNKTAKFYE